MRRTDQIAKEKFNGDIKETICYIMYEYKKDDLETFYDEWSKEELDIAKEVYMDALILKYGYDNLKKMMDNNEEINFTDEDIQRAKENHYSNKSKENFKDTKHFVLTEEELKKAEINPYKVNILKDVFKLILVNGSLIGLGTIIQNLNIGVDFKPITGLFTSIYTTMKALDIGPNIIDYFKFKNHQKELSNLENIGGKKL